MLLHLYYLQEPQRNLVAQNLLSFLAENSNLAQDFELPLHLTNLAQCQYQLSPSFPPRALNSLDLVAK